MSKKLSKQYSSAVLLFAVFAAVGFMLVNWLKTESPKQETPVETKVGQKDTLPTTQPTNSSDNKNFTQEKEKPVIEEVTPNAEPKPVRKISKAELTNIINNVNNKNYPRNVKLKYDNLDVSRGEEYQGSINNLRTWIKGGYCTITVTDVDYDETTGKVIGITIHINRNE